LILGKNWIKYAVMASCKLSKDEVITHMLLIDSIYIARLRDNFTKPFAAGVKIAKIALSKISKHSPHLIPGSSPKEISKLGRAGKRSVEQAAAAKAQFDQLISTINLDTSILCYTDGGCLNKLPTRPCGAGVYIKYPPAISDRNTYLSQGLGRGSNNIGEIAAVGLAMEDMLKRELPMNAAVFLFSDSKYTLNAVQGKQRIKRNAKLIRTVKHMVSKVNNKITGNVNFQWTAGHAGITGNEIADKLATIGTKNSISNTSSSISTTNELCSRARGDFG
jgi:ribonuclease HI